ncbi:MAG: monovalent cation/H(+) antiporter subunit G [Rhodospirillales bacterium]|nr:monovalent cation/H(+) antiporter subunit G [Rhodospirillales bacterium]
MAVLLDGLSWLCLVAGVLAALIGGIGLLRLPDVFSRMHAAGLIDTLAAGLIIVGLVLQSPSWTVAVKLILIIVFILFTSPTATHALARAALHGRVLPWLGDRSSPSEGAPSSKA